MARVLRRTVITGGVTYPPGTVQTPELLERISNPRAWEGEPDPEPTPAPRKRAARPTQKPVEPARAPQAEQSAAPTPEETPEVPEETPDEETPPEPEGSEQSETLEEPPRGGAGATGDAWREYASALGLEVPEDAGRDDIVALVDASRE